MHKMFVGIFGLSCSDLGPILLIDWPRMSTTPYNTSGSVIQSEFSFVMVTCFTKFLFDVLNRYYENVFFFQMRSGFLFIFFFFIFF